MADQPGETQSIDSGGSRLFDWFLLPLLSLCNCRREEKKEEVVIHNAAAPIDTQPEDVVQPNPHPPPAEIVKNGSGVSSSDSGWDITRVWEHSLCHGLTTESDLDPSTGLQPIDNEDTTLIEQLRLTDLPMLPLLAICGFLRTDGPCKDLYNFRQTCRSFAHAVNTFLENPTNLPRIDEIRIYFNDNTIYLFAYVQSINYIMHPVRADRATFPGKTGRRARPLTHVAGRFGIDDQVGIGNAAESLRGPVAKLYLSNYDALRDFGNVLSLLRNVTSYGQISISGGSLTDALGSFIVDLIPQGSNPAFSIEIVACDMTDFPTFLDRLYSSTRSVRFEQRSAARQSAASWQQFLQQLLLDGCTITCNYSPFTALTVLTEAPRDIRWSKP